MEVTTPKFPPPPFQGPEQIGILIRVGTDRFAFGAYKLIVQSIVTS